MHRLLSDIGRFFRWHWPHVLLAIPGAFVFTAAHELSHCAAVWLQGGVVTEFRWLPAGGDWGYMRYLFRAEQPYSTEVISLAPYACGLLLYVVAATLAMRTKPWPFWFASSLFIWFFVAPVADIANAASPYLLWNADNDFRDALGPVNLSILLILTALGVLLTAFGFMLQRRLYRERAISLPAYCVLAIVGALAILVAG